MTIGVLGSLGKCIDQPVLVSRFGEAVPGLLIGGSLLKCGLETYKAPKKEKKKTFIRTFCVLAGTITGALLATKQTLGLHSVKSTLENQKKIVSEILSKNKNISKSAKQILEKSGAGSILNPKEIQKLSQELSKNKNAKNILNAVIPPPQCVKAKDIIHELGSLSYLGLLPVIGGIAGGITGDALTEKDWKKKVPNKIKEGSFQYFANIFLCNIGAAAALGILEMLGKKYTWATSNMARVVGMASGIMATGVIGGSAIANWISKKFINPIFETKEEKIARKQKEKAGIKESIYSERKPELADMGLHIDDFATIGVFSGVKFIEPGLPLLYSLSGYRAGIGYRNNDESSSEKNKGHRHHH